MSQLLLQYTFDEGRVENPDGTLEGQLVGGAFEAVRADVPGWGPVSSAVRFEEGTLLLAPVPPGLAQAGAFTVEVVVRLERAPAAPMSLLAAVEPPLSLTLEPAPGGVRAVAAILSMNGWCVCASDATPVSSWMALSISFTGRELVLLQNGLVAARSAVGSRLAGGERRSSSRRGSTASRATSGNGRAGRALAHGGPRNGTPDRRAAASGSCRSASSRRRSEPSGRYGVT